MVERRDILKGIGVAAAAAATVTSATKTAEAQASVPLGPYATPWDPADPNVAGRMNLVRTPDDYFIPGRFQGKNVIVTGAARGMGEVAVRRLAREGANVVGVDILEELGAQTIESIRA